MVALESAADPDLVATLGLMPPIDLTDLPKVRAFQRERVAAAQATLTPVPGVMASEAIALGQVPVRLRVFVPDDEARPGAGLLWVHGGGLVAGGVDLDDYVCRVFSSSLRCRVVAVDYRLAPEHRYPAAVEDCYAALTWQAGWLAEESRERPAVTVAGASAGGGLAAALLLIARDRGEVEVDAAALFYPMLDDRCRGAVYQQVTDARVWNAETNRFGWQAYLGDALGADDVPAYAAPGRAQDLSGLPPTYLDVGTLDVFRDEVIDYASRLLAAGVASELHVVPGAFHASESLCPTADTSQRIRAARMDFLQRAVSGEFVGAGVTKPAAAV